LWVVHAILGKGWTRHIGFTESVNVLIV
jgi:hypothetical protein